jgi:hypothetical protein
MKKIFLYSLILSIIGFSCTDLEEDLYDKIAEEDYPENEAQIASIGTNTYSRLRPLIDDEGWWFLAQEVSSDEFCGPTRDADWDDGGKWREIHRHTWTNNTEGVNRMWSAMNQGAVSANQNIGTLNKLSQNDATAAKKAEMQLLRSLFYYMLMDNYGDIPYITNLETAPEFPYKQRRENVFDSLTTNIESILPNLKRVNVKNLATRYMAFALLAKLYINAEVYTGTPQWAKAEMFIDSVLAGPYSLAGTVTEPFLTSNENSSEIIFSIGFDEDIAQGFRLHMRSLHYQHNLKYDMTVGPWNGLCITPDQWNRYSSNDLRRDAYNLYGPQLASDGTEIIDGATEAPLNIDPILPALYMTANGGFTIDQYRNTGARVGKYEIAMGAKQNLSNDFPLFRLSDFYLMKAEVMIRQGGDGAGDAYITPIRTRAGLDPASGFGLDSLLAERARELYVEGHRRQDLIRFDKFTESWWEKGGNYEGVSGDPTVETFPIPKWALDANPNLLEDPQ